MTVASTVQPGEPSPAQEEFFEARVRPLFIEHCQRCHGSEKQKGGLRLDSRAALLKGGDNGPIVRPGDAEHSLLIQAIRHERELKMPPDRKLAPGAIATLTSWVAAGAHWPESKSANNVFAPSNHWAFRPVQLPQLPRVNDQHWSQTTVDAFVLAKLEKKGLEPSPAADRRTLIRRLSYDLIGLPPTLEEIAAYESDRSPDAFAKLVDRLLASPHYGERWGRHWLDVARFADTKGYVFFEDADFPWAWTYRDYVIHAFNDDLPYDRFILEQLAADRLPLGADQRPLTALGFLTLGGRFMSNIHDILDDRIDVVTRGLQGLTVTCARCHDHKYDPIPSRDYYSLYGVFASSVEPAVPPLYAPPPKTTKYLAFEKELKAREQKLGHFLKQKRTEVLNGSKTRVAEYLLAAHARRGQPITDDFMLIADGKDLNPKMLERWQAYLARTRKSHHPVFAPWHDLAEIPETQFAQKAREYIWRLDRQVPGKQVNPFVAKALAEKPPRSLADAAQIYSVLLNEVERTWNEKQPFKNSVTPIRTCEDRATEELRQVFHGPDAPPNLSVALVSDLELLPDRASQAQLQELRKAVEKWRAAGPAAPPRAMSLEDAPTPYEPHVFRRGNPNNLGDPVPRQFLEVLAGKERKPFSKGSGRLELANAIINAENPLTARVLVNRVWLHHFGAGLVRTPGDFGLRSDAPTHPELLDFLATNFRKNDYSIKHLHRLIVSSAVYQQQSLDRHECQRVDPDNLLLWKMNRRRLDFEATRDSLLAVSSRLDRTVGGPSVKNLFAATNMRRTLYGFLDRLNVPGLMRTFDFPSPDATSAQRDQTTVPQQALFLMNSPFVNDCAARLLQRPEVSTRSNTQKTQFIYLLLFGRKPTANELQEAHQFLAEGGTWNRYVQALLMVNEFVFID